MAEGLEILGMGTVAYGLFCVADWAGIIAGGLALIIIGAGIGVKK